MKKIVFALFAILALGSVYGVDLTNADGEKVHVKLDYGHDIVIEYDHIPGYTYENICANCKITVGQETTDVFGSDKYKIQGGKVVAAE